MFEISSPKQTNDVVVAATRGYSLLNFRPDGKKPSIQSINEIVQASSYPITAWRVKGDRAEPLSFAPADASGSRFIFSRWKNLRTG